MQRNVVSEWNTGGVGWSKGYVYLGKQLLAEYGDGTTYFVQGDHLASARMLTKPDQTVADAMDYLPFGEQLAGHTVTSHKFTGYDRDYVTGNDYAMARFYGYRAGSFLTPDPAGTSATCPFFPQTQNRYAYVTNNPVNRTDPTGLCGGDDPTPCDPINLPFPPDGGSSNPNPETPHPVFEFALPDIFRIDKVQCQCKLDSQRDINCKYRCSCDHGIGGIEVVDLGLLKKQCKLPRETTECPKYADNTTVGISIPDIGVGIGLSPTWSDCSNVPF